MTHAGLRVWAAAFGLLAVIFAVAFVLGAKFLPTRAVPNEEPEQVMDLVPPSGCDPIARRCDAVSGGAVVGLAFAPPVHTLRPFEATVFVSGLAEPPQSVKINYVMIGMDMGRNVYDLIPSEGSSVWKAKTLLPVCTSGRHDWRAEVEVRTARYLYEAAFAFQLD